MSSSRDKQVTDISVGFRPPLLVPILMGTSMASPYKSL